MSHDYVTHTYLVSSLKGMAASYISAQPLQAFLPAAVNRVAGAGLLSEVYGSTRNGWALFTLGELFKALKFSDLAFMGCEGHQYIFEDEQGGIKTFNFFDAEQQRTVVAAAEKLLARLAKDSDPVYVAELSGYFDENAVEAALARDFICSNPASNQQVLGDAGEGADYLFVYFRSLLAVFRAALAQGLIVVHCLEI